MTFGGGVSNVISVSELTKLYGQHVAVDHISFDVPKGQIVGFLGPNGAGKSTTLRMLTCFFPPTSGGATVNGFDIFHESEDVRQSIGYLPENVPLYMEMRVEEYLDYRGRLRGMNRADRRQRIDYVIDRCWLTSVRRRVIGQLSKGYRQRVGLADSLLHNPPVLILDEPTVGLDPTQIRETRKLMRELGGQHTVILSTHILPEVEAVCDRAIIIAGGRIVAQGSPEELRASRRLSARVLVECRAPAQNLKSILGGLPGVAEVDLLDSTGVKAVADDFVRAAIRPSDTQDVREAVSKAIWQQGWALREIRLEHATLEEYFVQVTAGQAVARQEAPLTDAQRAALGTKGGDS
jgi:ABC-2 type transport system ATP-binding protein